MADYGADQWRWEHGVIKGHEDEKKEEEVGMPLPAELFPDYDMPDTHAVEHAFPDQTDALEREERIIEELRKYLRNATQAMTEKDKKIRQLETKAGQRLGDREKAEFLEWQVKDLKQQLEDKEKEIKQLRSLLSKPADTTRSDNPHDAFSTHRS